MNLIDFKGESGKDGARTACFAYIYATPLVVFTITTINTAIIIINDNNDNNII